MNEQQQERPAGHAAMMADLLDEGRRVGGTLGAELLFHHRLFTQQYEPWPDADHEWLQNWSRNYTANKENT